MERHILVHVDIRGVPHLAGRLWARPRRSGDEYDRSRLGHPDRFSLEPAAHRARRQEAGPPPLEVRPGRRCAVPVPFRHEHARCAGDNETRSYLELVDALRRSGASPKEDIPSPEIDRMASAFEHADLQAAVGPRSRAGKVDR